MTANHWDSIRAANKTSQTKKVPFPRADRGEFYRGSQSSLLYRLQAIGGIWAHESLTFRLRNAEDHFERCFNEHTAFHHHSNLPAADVVIVRLQQAPV